MSSDPPPAMKREPLVKSKPWASGWTKRGISSGDMLPSASMATRTSPRAAASPARRAFPFPGAGSPMMRMSGRELRAISFVTSELASTSTTSVTMAGRRSRTSPTLRASFIVGMMRLTLCAGRTEGGISPMMRVSPWRRPPWRRSTKRTGAPSSPGCSNQSSRPVAVAVAVAVSVAVGLAVAHCPASHFIDLLASRPRRVSGARTAALVEMVRPVAPRRRVQPRKRLSMSRPLNPNNDTTFGQRPEKRVHVRRAAIVDDRTRSSSPDRAVPAARIEWVRGRRCRPLARRWRAFQDEDGGAVLRGDLPVGRARMTTRPLRRRESPLGNRQLLPHGARRTPDGETECGHPRRTG